MGRDRILDLLSDDADEAMALAQQALDAARRLPGGDERNKSLKEASKLRLQADKKRELANSRVKPSHEALGEE